MKNNTSALDMMKLLAVTDDKIKNEETHVVEVERGADSITLCGGKFEIVPAESDESFVQFVPSPSKTIKRDRREDTHPVCGEPLFFCVPAFNPFRPSS